MTLDYCIFCYHDFDSAFIEDIDIQECTFSEDQLFLEDQFKQDLAENIKYNINLVKNIKINFHCNHNYHLGCFVKYHSYKCNLKCTQKCMLYEQNYIQTCEIPCPLCTILIKKKDFLTCSKQIHKLHQILQIINKYILFIYTKIKISSCLLAFKKITNTIKLKNTHKFNRFCILYDDLLLVKKELSKYISFCQV